MKCSTGTSAVLALLAACGGSGTSTSGTVNGPPWDGKPSPPTHLTVSPGSYPEPGLAFDQVTLAWAPPPGPVDGYDVELSVDGGAFRQLNAAPLLAYASATLVLDSTIPELTNLTFRMRSIQGGMPSAYGEGADYQRGIRSAGAFTASLAGGGIELGWIPWSLVADQVILERAPAQPAGTPEPWVAVPGPTIDVHRWLDVDAPEGRSYLYRLRFGKGAVTSAPNIAGPTDPVPLLSPTNLVSSAGVERIELSWTNRSTAASELAILRTSGFGDIASSEVALLPPTATHFVDAPLAIGDYTYFLEARLGTVVSPRPSVRGVARPQPGLLPLDFQFLELPSGLGLVRNADGGWYVGGASSDVHVTAPPGVGWTEYRPPDAYRWAEPWMTLDTLQHLHLVFTRVPDGNGYQDIIHDFWDGSAWVSETVARRYCGSVAFIMDANDELHLFWFNGNIAPGTDGLEHAHRTSAGWSFSLLPAVPKVGNSVGGAAVSLEPSGRSHVLVLTFQSLTLLSEGSGGAWDQEQVPVQTPAFTSYDFIDVEAPHDGDVIVFFPQKTTPDALYASVRRLAGVWGSVESVGGSTSLSSHLPRVAVSRTGRLAVAFDTGSGQSVATHDGTAWASTLVGPDTLFADVALGFDANDKLYLLVRPGSPDPPAGLLYTEFP